jgi:hypothetical protein
MKKDFKGFKKYTPYDILRLFTEGGMLEFRKDYLYLILGKPGPTGKTWLTQELGKRGYQVSELSEELAPFLKADKFNHVIIDDLEKQVVVILNRDLPKQLWWKGRG